MKVLVSSRSFGQEAPEAIKRLNDAGIEVTRMSTPNPDVQTLAKAIPGYDALVVGNEAVSEVVLAASDKLKIVHMNGTGLDGIDITAATRHGVLVGNTPGANRNAVAELTVALMLISARSIHKYATIVDQGRWERSRGIELSNKCVGVLGLGEIGQRVIELLRGFEVSVCAYDVAPPVAWAAKEQVGLCESVKEVVAQADFLVLTLPLTDETHHLINKHTLALMKPTAYLINTARGGLVDSEALRQAVIQKRIAGAALDVFSSEPLAEDSPLRGLDLVLTPHLAASSQESSANVSHIVVDHLIDALIHGKQDFAVNAVNL